MKVQPGKAAVERRGWWNANRWLLLRRGSQLSILTLFLIGPLADVWIVRGNLNSSLTLDRIPLSDPYVVLQSLLAGIVPTSDMVLGGLIVVAIYMAIGGRAYCAWVCPVNVITDTADWLRRRLGITTNTRLRRSTRFWILGTTLVSASISGAIAWELVNPVSIVFRGMLFGFGAAGLIVMGVFLADLLISRQAWCGHLCPVGAFYSLLGHSSVLRIGATRREACNDCMDCYAVCPEPQVLPPALKGSASTTVKSAQCTNCGRCVDVCSEQVFDFVNRFNHKVEAQA